MTKRKGKIDILKMFEEEQTEFLDSLNEKIKDGMTADRMKVQESSMIETRYGEALRVLLVDLETQTLYSFLCSGKVFNKLFTENVKPNNILKIYLNEKEHWRFEFSE